MSCTRTATTAAAVDPNTLNVAAEAVVTTLPFDASVFVPVVLLKFSAVVVYDPADPNADETTAIPVAAAY